jgi:5-methylcytosine-specific restriction enzyme A
VLAAIAEDDRVGQPAFLSRYGFDPARLYLLVHDGRFYDSKAIVGAAHGYLPGEPPLATRQFSGGEATVGRLLRGLGFTVQVGDELTADRLERLLTKLQVCRSDGVPALYQPITLLWAFARAHRSDPRLVSWQETQRQVKALFQRHGRTGEGDRVFYPVAALHRAGLWELDADPEQMPSAHGSSVPQRWFDEDQPTGGLVAPVYDLVRESPMALAGAVNALVETYFIDADPVQLLNELGLSEPPDVSPLEMAFEARATEYPAAMPEEPMSSGRIVTVGGPPGPRRYPYRPRLPRCSGRSQRQGLPHHDRNVHRRGEERSEPRRRTACRPHRRRPALRPA